MLRPIAVSAFCLLSLAAPATARQDARSIMETALARQAERWATVDNYTVAQSVMNTNTTAYYEKTEVDGRPTFRMVQMGSGTPFESAMEDQPEGMSEVFGGMFGFLRPGMVSEEDRSGELGPDDFIQRAHLVGTETEAGRQAFHLRVDDLSDLDLKQPDDMKFTLHTMDLWIDADEYVPLRLRMDGEIENHGQVSPMWIERLDQDYRQVGPMYEPYRQVLRMSGLMAAMDEDQRRQMERAKAEMANMEDRIANLPPAQQEMVRRQMTQMAAMIERMTGGDQVFEMTINVTDIAINEGRPRS